MIDVVEGECNSSNSYHTKESQYKISGQPVRALRASYESTSSFLKNISTDQDTRHACAVQETQPIFEDSSPVIVNNELNDLQTVRFIIYVY